LLNGLIIQVLETVVAFLIYNLDGQNKWPTEVESDLDVYIW